jgi:hypothetical protein
MAHKTKLELMQEEAAKQAKLQAEEAVAEDTKKLAEQKRELERQEREVARKKQEEEKEAKAKREAEGREALQKEIDERYQTDHAELLALFEGFYGILPTLNGEGTKIVEKEVIKEVVIDNSEEIEALKAEIADLKEQLANKEQAEPVEKESEIDLDAFNFAANNWLYTNDGTYTSKDTAVEGIVSSWMDKDDVDKSQEPVFKELAELAVIQYIGSKPVQDVTPVVEEEKAIDITEADETDDGDYDF